MHMISKDLRIWLELEVPLIEDGNHFGTEHPPPGPICCGS